MFAKFTHQGPISLAWFNNYKGVNDRLHSIFCWVQILHTLNLHFIHVQNAVGGGGGGHFIHVQNAVGGGGGGGGQSIWTGLARAHESREVLITPSKVHQSCYAVNNASWLRGTKHARAAPYIFSAYTKRVWPVTLRTKTMKITSHFASNSNFVTHDTPIFWSSVLKKEKYSFLKYFRGRNQISKECLQFTIYCTAPCTWIHIGLKWWRYMCYGIQAHPRQCFDEAGVTGDLPILL